MPTSKQTRYYWSLWSQARKRLASAGYSPKEIEQERNILTEESLGYPKSSKDLTQPEFDKVLASIKAIATPADLNTQLDHLNAPRIRRIAAINKLGFPEAYVQQITNDRWGKTDLNDLSPTQLTHLIMTLKNRKQK